MMTATVRSQQIVKEWHIEPGELKIQWMVERAVDTDFLIVNKKENSLLKAIHFGLSIFFKPGKLL